MVDKTTIMATVLQRMEKLETGQCLDMRTYKRNRSVAIIRTGEQTFSVVEDGYEYERWDNLEAEKVKRLLKTLMKREFPRSNKIRLYTLDSYEEANVNRMAHGASRFGGK